MSNSTDDTGDDAEFAEWVRASARDYHAPPPVPRDAMWSALQARQEPAVAPIAARVTPVTRHWRLAGLAAAAMLVIGITFEAGRRSNNGSARATETARPALPSIAQVEPSARAPRSDSSILIRPRPTPLFPPSPVLQSDIRVALQNDRGRIVPPIAAKQLPTSPRSALDSADMGTSATAYGSASAQHLARAEALLAGFRAASGVDGDPAADAAWAADLLITTRLLLDSPAAREPDRRRLFEALELVLVQIARLPRAGTSDERSLIDRAIERGDLMTRLRATPARPIPSGT